MAYLYILGTILLTIYGQIILKWRIVMYGESSVTMGKTVIGYQKFLKLEVCLTWRNMMNPMYIEIPKHIVLSLKIPTNVVKKRLTEELAIQLYQEGFLSFGKSRELAGLSKWQFGERLGERGIARHYSKEDLEEDLLFAKGDLS